MSQVDGVQTHLVSSGWDDADDPQHLIISPTLATQPDQMLLFMRLPFSIPRTTRNLTARIGAQNVERPLVGIQGTAVKPRELTPGALHGMLIDTGAARFIEMLPPRPQDFIMVGAWSYTPSVPPDTASNLSAAELADPTTTEYTGPDFMVPQAPSGRRFEQHGPAVHGRSHGRSRTCARGAVSRVIGFGLGGCGRRRSAGPVQWRGLQVEEGACDVWVD